MKKILVFMGGMSREHDISVMTGKSVISSLPEAGYEPVPVFIGRDGRMAFTSPDAPATVDSSDQWLELSQALAAISDIAPDCVFIALHGTYGEDGRMQSLCDLMGLSYVGSGSIASATGIDKWTTRAIYLAADIPVFPAMMLQGRKMHDSVELDRIRQEIGFPMVIKSTREGSSFGIAIVFTPDEFVKRLAEVIRSGTDMVLFEKFVKGQEFSVPVIHDSAGDDVTALPVIEIVVHNARFFDYETKYDPDAVDEICPARISRELADRLQTIAVRAHRALMLKGFSRTDFIVAGDNSIHTLETNTLPGLTPYSLLPLAASVAGISYPRLLDILISNATRFCDINSHSV